MPDVLVTGGGSSLDGLAATLMRTLTSKGTANDWAHMTVADSATLPDDTRPDEG